MSSSNTLPKALDISSLEFYPLLRSSIYSLVAVHVSHNGCRGSKTKPSTVNILYICQQTDHLSLSTTIFCRCQQTSSVAVNKMFNCRRSLNQSTQTNHFSKNGLNEANKCFKANYIPTLYFVFCIVCCVVYCLLCITVLCCANSQMQIFSTKFNFCFIKTKIYVV